ncbi:MAG TPA: hypothetical protein VMU75_14245 [Acidimicrobiales bacterium]|nr:hypothetical protein [Acidimicrobiales bacterium]
MSHALVTGLVVGSYAYAITRATRSFDLPSPVAVGATTPVAAALFNPVRKRFHHLVDRRFHRARRDAEASDATVECDLVEVVRRAFERARTGVAPRAHTELSVPGRDAEARSG